MKKLLTILFVFLSAASFAQLRPLVFVADTVKIYSNSTNKATLQLVNQTKDVLGFLYNKGNGVTEFRQAARQINPTQWVFGNDTINIANGATYRIGANYNITKILLYENSTAIDSMDITPATPVKAGVNTYFTYSGDTLVINSSGGGGGVDNDADSLGGHPANYYMRYVDTPAMLLPYAIAINKNIDSITAHNLRLIKIIDSLTAHNLRIIKATDSLNAHNNRIGANTAAIGSKADKATTITINGVAHDLSSNGSWTVSGAGISGVTPKQLMFGKYDGTLQQDAVAKIDSLNSDGTRSVNIGGAAHSANYAGNTFVIVGNSVANGSVASTNYFRFGAVAVRLLNNGLIEDNRAVAGSTINTSSIALIPNKTGSMAFLGVFFGINEVPDSATWSHANFVTGFKKYLDTCIARGWSGSNILIGSIAGTSLGLTGYPNYRQVELNGIMDSLHTVYGTMFAECYNRLLTSTYNYIPKGVLHPGDDGHEVLGQIVAGALKGNFNMVDQKLVVNGNTQLSSLTYKNLPLVNKGQVVGADSGGKVGAIYYLPTNFSTEYLGKFIFGGSLLQRGIPSTLGYDSTSDIVLKTSALLQSGISSTNKTTFELFNTNNGQTTLRNQYAAGNIQFRVSGGSNGGNVLAMDILPSTGIINIPKGLTTDYSSEIKSVAGSGTGSFILLTASVNSEFYNKGTAGNWSIFMSNGAAANTTTAKMFNINALGRTILQQGGNYNDSPQVRLGIYSTSEGVLLPRMTTAQRDAMYLVSSVVITNGGSGYSSPPTITFSSGGASIQATTTNAVLSGGVITSIGLVAANRGVGYSSVPTITITGGGGTGATATAILGQIEGLEIYNLTTHRKEFWNGTAWVASSASEAVATDANYTSLTENFIVLPTISTNRNVVLPTGYPGREIKVWNRNSAGFSWTFTGVSVVDPSDVSVTTLVNDKVYTLMYSSTASAYVIISIN